MRRMAVTAFVPFAILTFTSAQAVAQQKLYTFTLSGPQVDLVLKGLLELPGKETFVGEGAVYPFLMQQLQAQNAPPIAPAPPKTPDPPKDNQ
jgi:hypothetical protein